jgi:YfiH family protein
VPVLIYASDIEAIGAIHSGWRGTSKKIVSKAITKLIEMGALPENIHVSIGPCIGQCCYEVSGDVASFFDEKYSVFKGNDKFMLDLGHVNYDLSVGCGVRDENISLSGICTSCHNDLFFSHRGQNGKCGTMGAIICMRD